MWLRDCCLQPTATICTVNCYVHKNFVVALWNVSPRNLSQQPTYFSNLLASVWQFQTKIGPHRLLFVESKCDPNVSCRVRKSYVPIKKVEFWKCHCTSWIDGRPIKNQIGTIFNACVLCPTSIVQLVVVHFLRIKIKQTVRRTDKIEGTKFWDEEHLFCWWRIRWFNLRNMWKPIRGRCHVEVTYLKNNWLILIQFPAGDDFSKEKNTKFYENKLYLYSCHSIPFLSFPFLFTCYMFKCLTRTNKTAKIYSVSVCVVSFQFEIYVTECFIRLLILPRKYLADWSLLLFFSYVVWSDQCGFSCCAPPLSKEDNI